MRLKLIAFFILLFVTAATAQPAHEHDIGPRNDYAEIAAKLEKLIQFEIADKRLPGFWIALVDADQIVWSRGFGFADPASKRPARASDIHRVASVSKLFTASAVMQLAERGKLDIDAPISRYLPGFAPPNLFNDQQITLRQLMSHRSGMTREPPVGHYFDPTEPTNAATVASLKPVPLVFAPATRMKYSNAGVAVVGQVVENVAGMPFAEHLERSLFTPMGMKSSSFLPRQDLLDRLAAGFLWTYASEAPSGPGREWKAPVFQFGMAPAANLYTSVNDLARFLITLFADGRGPAGDVLRPESLREMWRPQFAKPDARGGVGLGFFVGEFEGKRRISHGGVVYGYATIVNGMPDEKLGVVAVTTVDSSNPVPQHVADHAFRLMLARRAGKKLPNIPRSGPVKESYARKLVGRWGEGDRAWEITRERGGLYILPLGGGEKLRLRQTGEVLHTDDRLGRGMAVRIVGNELEINANRMTRSEPPGPKPAPASWKGLIGEYGWDHDILYIFPKDNRLYMLVEWYEFMPLEQEGEDVFAVPRGLYVGEKLAFVRDASGRATEAHLGAVVFKRR